MSVARIYARGVPWVEVLGGTLVLVGVVQVPAAAILLPLLVSFAIGVGANLLAVAGYLAIALGQRPSKSARSLP